MERVPMSDDVTVVTVRVSFTRKVSLANYNSASATVTVEGKIDEGSNIREATDYLMSIADDGVTKQLVKTIREVSNG